MSQTLKMHDSRNSKRKKKVLQQAKKNKMAELQCNRSSSCISFRKFPSPQPPQTPPLFDFLEGFVVVAPGLPTETTSFLLLLSIAQINMWLYRLSVYLYTPTGRRGWHVDGCGQHRRVRRTVCGFLGFLLLLLFFKKRNRENHLLFLGSYRSAARLIYERPIWFAQFAII